jgi:hypothetical protein
MAWKVDRWLSDVFPGADKIYSEYRTLPPRELAIIAAGVLDVALTELISLRLADYPSEAEDFLGLNGDGRAPAGSSYGKTDELQATPSIGNEIYIALTGAEQLSSSIAPC